jgi:hypothetical protein
MGDVQKKLQELSDSYQGLQAGMRIAAPGECSLTSEQSSEPR